MGIVRGSLVVMSAPSGAGKSSLVRRLVAALPDIVFSVSATTRAPRPGERDGVDYHFLERERFQQLASEGQFLEHAVVHGNLYGTLRGPTERLLGEGRDVLLEIDVQGARSVKGSGIGAELIFIMPPSRAELERRLRGRGQDPEESIQLRLRNAGHEVAQVHLFDWVVVNDDLEDALAQLVSVMKALRSRRGAQAQRIGEIARSFGVQPGAEP